MVEAPTDPGVDGMSKTSYASIWYSLALFYPRGGVVYTGEPESFVPSGVSGAVIPSRAASMDNTWERVAFLRVWGANGGQWYLLPVHGYTK